MLPADAKNLTFEDFTMYNSTGTGVFSITQCTTFSGVSGDCNSSLFNIRNVTVKDIKGYVSTSYVADMKCSAAAPCTGIEIENINLTKLNATGAVVSEYECSSVEDTLGFSC